MSATDKRPQIPRPISRQLRKEAGLVARRSLTIAADKMLWNGAGVQYDGTARIENGRINVSPASDRPFEILGRGTGPLNIAFGDA